MYSINIIPVNKFLVLFCIRFKDVLIAAREKFHDVGVTVCEV